MNGLPPLPGELENAVAAGQTTPTAAAVAIVEALKSLG